MRALYAQKTNLIGITGTYVDYTEYSPRQYNAFYLSSMVSSGLTSAPQGITANPIALSDWFIPSHDEMAFIAMKTIGQTDFNLTESLLLNGQPLNGTYWTSTGTFNYNKPEGIYDGVTKPEPGSVAISMYFSGDGNGDLYEVKKEDRGISNKVRPIRIIRCDEQYPNNLKLWNLPKI